MAIQNLPISRLVKVNVVLTPLAAQAQNLSTLLILGNSDIIDVVQRVRTYDSIDAVASDFGTSAPEYLAALLWFEQAPQPSQLMIGRWAKTATAGKLIGGALSSSEQAIAAWNAIASGSFGINIDGIPLSITGLNFGASANLNGVASVIQTAIRLLSANVNVVWDANLQDFTIESGTTGPTSIVGFVTAPTATGKFTFAGQPAADDTITLNGTAITFKAGGAVGNQVNIGVDLPTTLSNLLTFLNASADAQLVKFHYYVVGSVLYVSAVATGAAGNALTTAKSGANITVSGATLAGGSGTDISAMLGMTSTFSGAYRADGITAETALAAAVLFDTLYGQQWYALMMVGAVDADHLAVAPYIEAANNKHLYGVSTQEAGVLSSVSTTDIAYEMAQLRYKRTVVIYSSSNAYAVASVFGRALTVNYNGNSTVITLMYKQLPGIVAESLTASQVGALEAKNCNVFVAYNNNTAILEQGKVSSGDFIDVLTGTDWLAVTIMTALYNLLYTSPTKIPQTDAGTHLLVVTAENVCSQGVVNGLLAPGVWNSAGFGTLKQGDFIPAGFYVYAPPVASQLQADREARKSVPIQIAAKLAGAVHTIDVTITVNR